MTIQAFFLSDQAEMYQEINEEMEDFFYGKAAFLLKEARQISGLETKSPEYTVASWKAYRHKDMESTKKWGYKEHLEIFSKLSKENRSKFSKRCVENILKAGKTQKANNWEDTDNILEIYFEFYFKALGY